MSRKFIAAPQRGKARFQRANRSRHKADNPASRQSKRTLHTQAPYHSTIRPFYRQTHPFLVPSPEDPYVTSHVYANQPSSVSPAKHSSFP